MYKLGYAGLGLAGLGTVLAVSEGAQASHVKLDLFTGKPAVEWCGTTPIFSDQHCTHRGTTNRQNQAIPAKHPRAFGARQEHSGGKPARVNQNRIWIYRDGVRIDQHTGRPVAGEWCGNTVRWTSDLKKCPHAGNARHRGLVTSAGSATPRKGHGATKAQKPNYQIIDPTLTPTRVAYIKKNYVRGNVSTLRPGDRILVRLFGSQPIILGKHDGSSNADSRLLSMLRNATDLSGRKICSGDTTCNILDASRLKSDMDHSGFGVHRASLAAHGKTTTIQIKRGTAQANRPAAVRSAPVAKQQTPRR